MHKGASQHCSAPHVDALTPDVVAHPTQRLISGLYPGQLRSYRVHTIRCKLTLTLCLILTLILYHQAQEQLRQEQQKNHSAASVPRIPSYSVDKVCSLSLSRIALHLYAPRS